MPSCGGGGSGGGGQTEEIASESKSPFLVPRLGRANVMSVGCKKIRGSLNQLCIRSVYKVWLQNFGIFDPFPLDELADDLYYKIHTASLTSYTVPCPSPL